MLLGLRRFTSLGCPLGSLQGSDGQEHVNSHLPLWGYDFFALIHLLLVKRLSSEDPSMTVMGVNVSVYS